MCPAAQGIENTHIPYPNPLHGAGFLLGASSMIYPSLCPFSHCSNHYMSREQNQEPELPGFKHVRIRPSGV